MKNWIWEYIVFPYILITGLAAVLSFWVLPGVAFSYSPWIGLILFGPFLIVLIVAGIYEFMKDG